MTAPRNVGASVRARLLERARAQRADFQVLLTRYVLERLLYRLSSSEHRDRFILKGAMLLATWVETPFRATRDLDLLGSGPSDLASIAEAFRAICSQAVPDDGVEFDARGLEAAPIREELKYGGVRVRTTALIDRARIPVQIDVGFGDAITPDPSEIKYPVLLDAPAPWLKAYPIQTVVAEKFEAVTLRGIANSRLKDFYDLYLIAQTYSLDPDVLAEAIRRTFERRGTALPTAPPVGLTEAYAQAWATQWRAFLTRERMAAVPDALDEVIATLRDYLMPLAARARISAIGLGTPQQVNSRFPG
jgi:predicted nucleotidyltransferase component of viral defense system